MGDVGKQDRPASSPDPLGGDTNEIAYYVPVSVSTSPSSADLIDVLTGLWQRRSLIVGTAFLLGALALAASFLLSNVYRAEVLMAPAGADDDPGALASLGGLASLAGIDFSGRSKPEEDLAILTSRNFLWEFVDKHDLMPVLFEEDWDDETDAWQDTDIDDQPNRWDAYRLLTEEVLNVSMDRKTGIIHVSVDWIDEHLASEWANSLVKELNEYLRRKSIERSENNLSFLRDELVRSDVAEVRQTVYRLIATELQDMMLANTQEEYAFRVLDSAAPPDKKVRPQRLLIGIFSAFLGCLIATSVVLFQILVSGRSLSNLRESDIDAG